MGGCFWFKICQIHVDAMQVFCVLICVFSSVAIQFGWYRNMAAQPLLNWEATEHDFHLSAKKRRSRDHIFIGLIVFSLGDASLRSTATQDASHKWRFSLGFPTKNGIILVVTIASWVGGSSNASHVFAEALFHGVAPLYLQGWILKGCMIHVTKGGGMAFHTIAFRQLQCMILLSWDFSFHLVDITIPRNPFGWINGPDRQVHTDALQKWAETNSKYIKAYKYIYRGYNLWPQLTIYKL